MSNSPGAIKMEPRKAIPTMVQIPLERTEGEQASRLQVIAIKPNKILPKQAIIALSPEYFHQLWLPASDANLNTCKLRIPQECIHTCYCHFRCILYGEVSHSNVDHPIIYECKKGRYRIAIRIV